MIEIKQKDLCSGCNACSEICPTQCISMIFDVEGFAYPSVNKEACINCKRCTSVCPFLNPSQPAENLNAYFFQSTDNHIRTTSSSGGAFWAFVTKALADGGKVYGAKLENLECKHSSSQTFSGCEGFRKSKYVQSDICGIFKQVESDLQQDIPVLFSGTPCQVAGLKHFLGKEYKGLFCIDVICHGVPSPKVFKRYCLGIQKKFNKAMKHLDFRNKKTGWQCVSNMEVLFDDNSVVSIKNDKFLKGFLLNLYLRPSCYACKANGNRSGSDVTLADYWGFETIHPKNEDGKGTSLMIAKTSKGVSFIQSLYDLNTTYIAKTDLSRALVFNKTLYFSSGKNLMREQFFFDFEKSEEDFNKVVRKYLKFWSAPKTYLAIMVKKIFGYQFFNRLFFRVCGKGENKF